MLLQRAIWTKKNSMDVLPSLPSLKIILYFLTNWNSHSQMHSIATDVTNQRITAEYFAGSASRSYGVANQRRRDDTRAEDCHDVPSRFYINNAVEQVLSWEIYGIRRVSCDVWCGSVRK